MSTKKVLHIVSFALVVIGGLNWGIFGLFGNDIVDDLFGNVPTLAEIIYVLIGAATVYLLVTHAKDCKTCAAK